MKQCSKCQINKNELEFYKDKRTKSGFYSACKECCYVGKREYMNQYRKKNVEYQEYIKQYGKEHRKKNLEYFRNYRLKYTKKRILVDSKFHLNRVLSTAIWIALKGKKAGRKWERLVGYTIDNLINHIEKRFDDKMNWNNYGSYWTIDHIKPQSLFNYKSAEDKEFRDCWALENLQPLEKIANIKKSNNY